MPDIAEANRRALMAGYNYGETTEAFTAHYSVPKAKLPPGKYRNITGNQALAWGLSDRCAAERLRAVFGFAIRSRQPAIFCTS